MKYRYSRPRLIAVGDKLMEAVWSAIDAKIRFYMDDPNLGQEVGMHVEVMHEVHTLVGSAVYKIEHYMKATSRNYL